MFGEEDEDWSKKPSAASDWSPQKSSPKKAKKSPKEKRKEQAESMKVPKPEDLPISLSTQSANQKKVRGRDGNSDSSKQ